MADKIKFSYYGKEYEMTPEEIEAAYRYQENAYHLNDVQLYWKNCCDEYCDECDGKSCHGCPNYPFNEQQESDIVEIFERYLGRCDPYYDTYWACMDDAIEFVRKRKE